MEKRNIGKSGLSAPFLGMGTWAIGGGSWWGTGKRYPRKKASDEGDQTWSEILKP